ncbi:unnamed protein product [Scytosiphon promiscuus]
MAFNSKNPTSVIPKPNVEAVIHGSAVLNGKGGMNGKGEWLNGEYEDRHLPLTWKQGRAMKSGAEDSVRRRACKRGQEAGEECKDEQEDEEEEEEEYGEEEEEDSDSDYADSEGFTHSGQAQSALHEGHLCINRDHHDFDVARRENEQVQMNVLESGSGWYTVSGFSTTKQGRLDLKGFINPAGSLHVFKAEDIMDASVSSAESKGKTSKAPVRRRLKLTKPVKMFGPPSTAPPNRRPQHISGKNSSQNWTILRAHRELATNLIDQAKVTLKKVFPYDTPRLEPPQITRNDDGETKVVFFAKTVKLAEILYQRKRTKWVRSYELNKTRYEPGDVIDSCFTWVLTYINYGACILPKHFLRGESGQEKDNDLSLTGKFGDGLPSAADYVVRRGINFLVTAGGYTESGGYTTRCILDKDGSSYFQHESNKQSEHRVVITLTFMPDVFRTYGAYLRMYTENVREPFDPETFDPMSFCLPVNADAVFVETHGPGSDPSAILMDEDMKGMMHNRGFWVAEMGCDEYLFGYDFADPKRNMIEGRDRGAMNAKVTRPEIDRLLSGGIKIDPRVRRQVVLDLTQGHGWKSHNDVRPQKWSKEIIKLLQLESRTMFPGTVLIHSPTPIEMMVAGLRDLKRTSCSRYIDEGSDLVDAFVKELRSLQQEVIRPDAAAQGWAPSVRDELLRVTGATEMATVDFPGKLQGRHVVWVEEDVVLISRRSLAVNLGQEDAKTAKFLLDIISCSMEREFSFERLSNRVFEVYHLIMSAVRPVEEAASTGLEDAALGKGGTQGCPERGADSQHEQEARGVASITAGPKPTPAAVTGERTNQRSLEIGRPQAMAAATQEESSEESDEVGGGGVMDGEESAGEEGGPATTPSDDSQPGDSVKRTHHTVSEKGPAGEGPAKRRKHYVSDTGKGGPAEHPATSGQAEKASMVSPTLSVKVEPRSAEGGTSSAPQPSEDGARQVSVVAAAEPVQSIPNQMIGGPGIGQEPEDGRDRAPAASAKMRSGEELEAFLAEDGGMLVPALGQILHHVLDDAGGSIDLYRLVGRERNKGKACERFSKVMANERVRRLLEFAVAKPGVDISLFCWDDPGALRGFVGKTGRVFLNIFSPKSIDEWAETDLPTTLAHEVAHARSSTPDNVHSHAWSVEYREWVRSEEF